MDNIVSIAYADTFSYKNKEEISRAVFEAMEKAGITEGLIQPGMNVLIKPNLVMDKNQNENGGTDCLYTQAAVVEPVLQFAIKCLKGKGKIVIGDAPMQECVFDNIVGYKEMVERYQRDNECGVKVQLVDFRELVSVYKDGIHYSQINKNAKGKIINLGKYSEFFDVNKDSRKMRVTNYDPRILPKHHYGEKQEYYVSEYLLNADVIINMPKPKCHRKGGVTIALKNLVGINTRKEFLPHHTKGAKQDGGDEYLNRSVIHSFRSTLFDYKNILEAKKKYSMARIIKLPIGVCSLLLKNKKSNYSEGSWYGNDTISRTIVDLNRIAFYADKRGDIQTNKQRKMIIVADMIVSGEKEGPVLPSPKNVGIIAAGQNPVCFDEAISTMMGFDYKKIPSIVRARKSKSQLPLVDENEQVFLISNKDSINEKKIGELESRDLLWFEPTSGWKNHIEKGRI